MTYLVAAPSLSVTLPAVTIAIVGVAVVVGVVVGVALILYADELERNGR